MGPCDRILLSWGTKPNWSTHSAISSPKIEYIFLFCIFSHHLFMPRTQLLLQRLQTTTPVSLLQFLCVTINCSMLFIWLCCYIFLKLYSLHSIIMMKTLKICLLFYVELFFLSLSPENNIMFQRELNYNVMKNKTLYLSGLYGEYQWTILNVLVVTFKDSYNRKRGEQRRLKAGWEFLAE